VNGDAGLPLWSEWEDDGFEVWANNDKLNTNRTQGRKREQLRNQPPAGKEVILQHFRGKYKCPKLALDPERDSRIIASIHRDIAV
jgi:hypothetical protein